MNDKLQDVLFDGEELLWQGKPHKLCYVLKNFGKLLPVAIIFLLFDGFFISTIVSTGAFKEIWWFIVIFFAFHLIPVWSCIGKIITSNLEHKNLEYAFTSRRVIARSGILGVDFNAADYADITNVFVNVSIIERLFKVGTIIVQTSSETPVILVSIKEPYVLYKKITKTFVDVKTDIHYPNAFRPDNNPGYNTKYTEK